MKRSKSLPSPWYRQDKHGKPILHKMDPLEVFFMSFSLFLFLFPICLSLCLAFSLYVSALLSLSASVSLSLCLSSFLLIFLCLSFFMFLLIYYPSTWYWRDKHWKPIMYKMDPLEVFIMSNSLSLSFSCSKSVSVLPRFLSLPMSCYLTTQIYKKKKPRLKKCHSHPLREHLFLSHHLI